MMAAESMHEGMSLAQLLAPFASPGTTLPEQLVGGLATDSRLLAPGDLFLAGKGLQVHGLAHLEQALQRGAAAVAWEPDGDPAWPERLARLSVPVVAVADLRRKLGVIADRFYAHPSAAMQVIGVTGTDGKTSVAHFIAQALSDPGRACGLLGTLGYGVYGDLHPATHTTPDALRLQAEFARLRAAGVRQVAMEVSSHALHQYRSDGTRFATAVLTQLSRDHLDYHGSLEAYAAAKQRLFMSPGLRAVVLNAGDAFGCRLATRVSSQLQVFAYGHPQHRSDRLAEHWLTAESVAATAHGMTVEVNSSRGRATLTAAVLGAFNADNLMAALGALLSTGLTLDEAVRRLRTVSPVPGRMELFDLPGRPAVVVDYAHTPHALASVLQALRPHCRGKLFCVFGAGGDRDPGKRPQMGAAAERYADVVVLTSDNPRNEPAERIIDQIAAGLQRPRQARRLVERGAAIEAAIAAAQADDLVLIAGKGHEDYQQIGAQRLPFSDRERVRLALRGRGE